MANSPDNRKDQKIGLIERIGGALPESNILFLILTAIIIVLSCFIQGTYKSISSGQTYDVINMASVTGLRWIIYNFIENFRHYPPLGIVIVGVIGFNFAEKVGVLGTLIKAVGNTTPEKFILPVIVFVGINSSIASDAGYIVLIPLAGALYAGLGKNPLTGIAAAFASVSAGFGAALIPTPGDGLLGSITRGVVVNTMGMEFTLNEVTMNLLFMIFSTFYLTFIISVVTKRFIEKRANHHKFTVPEEGSIKIGALDDTERQGLKKAGISLAIVLLILIVFYAIGVLSPFEHITESGEITIKNPLLDNIIVIMVLIFLFPSISYGKAVGKICNTKEYISITTNAMSDMAYILVFAIFAGNFLAIFSHSGLDKFISNTGARMLIDLNIQNNFALLIMFILICCFINLFMGSASAKWVLLSPVFIPMLMNVSNFSLSPDQIQAAYRIADSSTNIITPLMTYAGVILIFAKKYVPKFEIGDLISLMVPYSICILLSWTAFFIVWLKLGIPFGI